MENYSIHTASWFTGTVLCRVKHPVYGSHKLTPQQIKTASGEYKTALFQDMKRNKAEIINKLTKAQQ